MQTKASVAVYVVTYRRPTLLQRALRSVVAQTHGNWVCRVINDDPQDKRVSAVIESIGDSRIHLFRPVEKRGGSANFNLAFSEAECPFASILEDDNWWEPSFLETMLVVLESSKTVSFAVANEKQWKEQLDGSWLDTGKTIWPSGEDVEEFHCRILDKCGSAKLCNSSMLFRTLAAESFQTPDTIPIDVTEHFRERVVPHPILLVRKPLVNFSDTLVTHRSKGQKIWNQYQILLVGSVFKLAREDDRLMLASALWKQVRSENPLSRNTLLATGLFIPEARDLWRVGKLAEKILFLRSCVRRPGSLFHALRAKRDHEDAWKFLQTGWFADSIRNQGKIKC